MLTKRPRHISAAILGLAAAALMAGGCDAEFSVGTDTEIDPQKAEDNISAGLEQEYGEPPASLECPEGVEAVKGETFVCTGTTPEDPPRPFEIEVTMTDDEGAVTYPLRVDFTDKPAKGS